MHLRIKIFAMHIKLVIFFACVYVLIMYDYISLHGISAVFDIKKSTMSQNVAYQLEFCGKVPLSYHHLSISVLAPVSGKGLLLAVL